jgi:acetylornithine deacetylase/succinyl-diaminopimelate desuccinylase-like protein
MPFVGRSPAASLVVALVTAVAASPLAAQDNALAPHQRLARAVFKELIEINTADSVGSVTRAAQAMARRFRAAGFPASDVHVLVPPGKPTKGNLVVRYRGHGRGKPILLLAHLDVVAALRSDWSLDPFVLTEKDGYFYGRGTTDDKAMAAIFVANMIRDKRAGRMPDRDVVLALTADEEGGDANGVAWLLAKHRDLIDAAYAINEGSFGWLRDGKPLSNGVQAAEKVSMNFTVTATNRGGHSSLPRPDNAIYELAEGLVKLSRFRFPVQLNEVSRAFFERTAALEKPDVAAAMQAIVANPNDSAASAVLSADPTYNSMLRTTCVATRLAGGHAYNALPQTASVNVNCRIVPTQSVDEVRETLGRVLADTGLRITATFPGYQIPSAPPSPLSAEIIDPITEITHAMFGANVAVIPVMSTWATDGFSLRAAGIPTYGVNGIFIDPNDIRMHGRDERLLAKSFYDGQEFLHRLVARLAGGTSITP